MAKNNYIIGYILIFSALYGISSYVADNQKTVKKAERSHKEIIVKEHLPFTKKETTKSEQEVLNYDCLIVTAQKYVGVGEEGGNNKGVKIDYWLQAVGIKYAAPWCAAFLAGVFNECGYENPNSAWSPSWATHISGVTIWQARKNYSKPKEYEKGMVFTLYYSNLKRVGHVGMIEAISGEVCSTIEGNVTMRGTRETSQGKDGVMRLKRDINKMYNIRLYNNKIK